MAPLARYHGLLLLVALLAAGCGHSWLSKDPPPGYAPAPENPLFVPACDRDFLWNQLVDTLDDYFRIEREEQLRVVGNIVMEGRVTTFPVVGATYLEPWRHDSTYGFERLHSTLQSIRRQAHARVIPVENGYLVEVIVNKELEDVDRPEHAAVGALTQRHDGSLVRNQSNNTTGSFTLGWISLGRDATLEEKMLIEFRGRMLSAKPSRLPPAK